MPTIHVIIQVLAAVFIGAGVVTIFTNQLERARAFFLAAIALLLFLTLGK